MIPRMIHSIADVADTSADTSQAVRRSVRGADVVEDTAQGAEWVQGASASSPNLGILEAQEASRIGAEAASDLTLSRPVRAASEPVHTDGVDYRPNEIQEIFAQRQKQKQAENIALAVAGGTIIAGLTALTVYANVAEGKY